MLPNFIIAGASRSGTTTLWKYLRNHPDVFMPDQKEIRFFEQNDLYHEGQDFYEGFFNQAPENKVIGEASPPYFEEGAVKKSGNIYYYDIEDDAPTRIKSMIPDVKIILTLRSPITRLYSQYIKNLRQGKENYYELQKSLEAEINGEKTYLDDHTSWIYKNSYSIHLKKWFKLFPKENILILIFEEWTKDSSGAFSELSDFLNISREGFDQPEAKENENREPISISLHKLQKKYFKGTLFGKILYRLNQKKSSSVLDKKQFIYLRAIFKDEIKEVEYMLNKDLKCWMRNY